MYLLLIANESAWGIVSATVDCPPRPTKAGVYLILDTHKDGKTVNVTPAEESAALLRRAADSVLELHGRPPLTDEQALQMRAPVIEMLGLPEDAPGLPEAMPAPALPDEPEPQPMAPEPPASQPDEVPVDPPSGIMASVADGRGFPEPYWSGHDEDDEEDPIVNVDPPM